MLDEGGFRSPYQVLKLRAAECPHLPAYFTLRLGIKRFQEFHPISWLELFKRVQAYGVFLKNLGLRPGDRVGILARNSAEWLISDFAILSAGFVSVPFYIQSSPLELRTISKSADLKLVLVDEKRPVLPVDQILFSELEDFFASATEVNFSPYDIEPDDLATIIYTSGTSGLSKGVMHSFANFYHAVNSGIEGIKISESDRLFSYLPLSHVAERTLIQWGALYSGAVVYILDRVERLVQYLPAAQPTIFFSVPRVWETFASKIDRELKSKAWTKWIPGFLKPLLLGSGIRKKLGLGRARICATGAAKLSGEVSKKFKEWGIDLIDAYGLTETLGISTIDGLPFPGVEIQINPDGELCLRARFHFLGYYGDPVATESVIKEGWFPTGDIATKDSSGRVVITDRKKNIFKSSNGKYIAPWPIEAKFKEHPAIKEILVLGENEPYCVAFASVDPEFENTAALEELLKSVNNQLAPHEQIQTLGYTRVGWTVDGGEMTPTHKLKRFKILEQYKEQIHELYESRTKVRYFQ